MKKLFELFLNFAKIGLFTFGGGYAMLPLIERTCVEKKQWITNEDMTNVTVMAESTPGPVAINCATFVGYRQKGFLGALFATLGMITPSFVIILIISYFLESFLEIKWVASAFAGIKIAVGILIIDAALRLLGKLPKKALPVTITVLSCLVILAVNFLGVRFSSVIILVTAAAVSFFVYVGTKNRTGGKENDLS
ncbi:MAG: chromate transporter [Eubacterium sp.]|nr:chromate transporter [Eubacterium sp.]